MIFWHTSDNSLSTPRFSIAKGLMLRVGRRDTRKKTTVFPRFALLSSAFSLAIDSRHRSKPLFLGSYRPEEKK